MMLHWLDRNTSGEGHCVSRSVSTYLCGQRSKIDRDIGREGQIQMGLKK